MKALDRSMVSQVNGGTVADAGMALEVLFGGLIAYGSLCDPTPHPSAVRGAFFFTGSVFIVDGYQRIREKFYAENI